MKQTGNLKLVQLFSTLHSFILKIIVTSVGRKLVNTLKFHIGLQASWFDSLYTLLIVTSFAENC